MAEAIHIQYDGSANAKNAPEFKEIVAARGSPSQLEMDAIASMANPTPMAFSTRDRSGQRERERDVDIYTFKYIY